MKEQQVRDIIILILQMSGEKLDESAEKQWDSLLHVSILVELDTELDGKMANIIELQDAYSVASIVSVLRSNNLLS